MIWEYTAWAFGYIITCIALFFSPGFKGGISEKLCNFLILSDFCPVYDLPSPTSVNSHYSGLFVKNLIALIFYTNCHPAVLLPYRYQAIWSQIYCDIYHLLWQGHITQQLILYVDVPDSVRWCFMFLSVFFISVCFVFMLTHFRHHLGPSMINTGFSFDHLRTGNTSEVCRSLQLRRDHGIFLSPPSHSRGPQQGPPRVKLDCSCPVCTPTCRARCVALSQRHVPHLQPPPSARQDESICQESWHACHFTGRLTEGHATLSLLADPLPEDKHGHTPTQTDRHNHTR